MKPLKDMRVTSPFGPRKAPLNGASTFHSGVDLAASIGTECFAIEDGVVKAARNYPTGIGLYIVIEHKGICTTYGHLSRFLVKEGQSVRKGEVVALTGNSGNSTGPHLHLEIRETRYGADYWAKHGNYYKAAIDPIEYMNRLKEAEPNYKEALMKIQDILKEVLQ